MHTLKAILRPVPEQISGLRLDFRHSVALSHLDRRMNYEELNRRADRFASHLAKLGVESNGTVALCMERSFDWIVAALGIMRAGAAYVPLDPAWPDERLRYAVSDSGATVLVARTTLLDRLQVDALGIDPGRDAAAIAAAPLFAHRPIEPESLAYVVYTSGSSGVPKGVEITHANLAHLIRWHLDTFSVTHRDRASHLASLGFDAAVWEIWPHLCAGTTVCLAEDAVRSSPELLQQWLIRERVTISFVPTIHAAPLMEMDWPPATALRFLLTGGDTLHHSPGMYLPFQVVNNYGPTECTVVATSTNLHGGLRETPPIGRAIAGASIYLLDERGAPVQDGRTGEIYIGGDGVGRGYRNLPEATQLNFLPDPFAATPGARMYRTGDRGCARPDGQIEFRGRLDRQTKIRGQRIELDEIASVLSHHPGVEFATAIVSSPQAGWSRLVAYILPKENASVPIVPELQKHLLRSLPDYMIPSIFVCLKVLPLGPNGKLDLSLLPQPTEANMLKMRAPAPPTSPIEEKLLGIVRELLECDEVGLEDNFFLAGGHSLLGMQLVMNVEKAFGVDLTLQQLFESPTIQRLGSAIEAKLCERRMAAIWESLLGHSQSALDDNFHDQGGRSHLLAALQQHIAAEFGRSIPIAELLLNPTIRQQAALAHRQVQSNRALPPGVLALHPEGKRKSIFWLHYINGSLAKAMGDDQPFFAVTLNAQELASLGQSPALERIAACHTRKILEAQSCGPYNIGGQCLGGILAYEVASQLRTAGHEVTALVLLDVPFFSWLRKHGALSRQLSHLRHLVKKAARRGLRATVVQLRAHLLNRFPGDAKTVAARTEMQVAQQTIEAAARAYQPEEYSGKVLLLLASDRPTHLNYLPGWQAIVPDTLHIQYVHGSHSHLMSKENVRGVADAILPHLAVPPPNQGRQNAGLDEQRTPRKRTGQPSVVYSMAPKEAEMQFTE
jgi:amino acid adenylation domain-containing protein